MKLAAKESGYKIISDSIYYRVNDYFIHGFYFVRFFENKYQLLLRPSIKLYSYDNILWTLIQMEDNKEEKDAFRANGAFVAPSVQWSEFIYSLTTDSNFGTICAKAINDLVSGGAELITEIVSKYGNFDSYVLSLSGIMDESLLKILAHINSNNYLAAVDISQRELDDGSIGKFQNKGVGINEYVIDYYKEKNL